MSSTSSSDKVPQVVAVIGAQWGDEGKGKLVDLLAGRYDMCGRAQGGANAGHTIVADGVKYKFHLMPSGIVNKGCVCVVGNGVVVHLPTMEEEIANLEEKGVDYAGRLFISDRAHLVFDFHKKVDGLREQALKDHSIGTTKRGIGPTYSSKMNRDGLRLCDLKHESFGDKLRELLNGLKAAFPGQLDDVDEEEEIAKYKELWQRVEPITCDTVAYLNEQLDEGKTLLLEGANATMLDIDFGTYPFVTSSNCTAGGFATGLGISPLLMSELYGVVKAYTTRVGEGPFPTELEGDLHDKLSQEGHEVGTTTGRPRRCGWLDVVQMRYSQAVNRYTYINLTKLDVLSAFDEIKVGVKYIVDGKEVTMFPASLESLKGVEVEYEVFEGWKTDISECQTFDDLPDLAQAYVKRVEELLGVPIKWIGVGPGRTSMIERDDV